MKQLVVLMLVAALAVPALAEVAVTATAGATDGTLTITVTPSNGAGIRGVALALTRTSGDATVADSSKVTTTGLNTFIDYGFSVPTGFDVNVGHAAANIAAAGVATFPATNLSLCAGYLAPSGQLALTTPATFVVDYDGTAGTIGIALDTLRGGIVGDNLGAITVQASQVLGFSAPECVKSTAPFYATWVAFGKPDCWCYRRNCRGEANNLKSGFTPATYVWVNSADLTILAGAFNKNEATLQTVVVNGVKGICADNNRAKSGFTPATYVWVNSADLTVLAQYFNKVESLVPVCDQTNYNFWTN